MKTAATALAVLLLAVPVAAKDTKRSVTKTTVSTQSSVLIGTLGTTSTVSMGTVLTLGAAAAVQSTGHTK